MTISVFRPVIEWSIVIIRKRYDFYMDVCVIHKKGFFLGLATPLLMEGGAEAYDTDEYYQNVCYGYILWLDTFIV